MHCMCRQSRQKGHKLYLEFSLDSKATTQASLCLVLWHIFYQNKKLKLKSGMFCLLCSLEYKTASIQLMLLLEPKNRNRPSICSLRDTKTLAYVRLLSCSMIRSLYQYLKTPRPAWPCQNYSSVSRCLFFSAFFSGSKKQLSRSHVCGRVLCFRWSPKLPQYFKIRHSIQMCAV
jgi:hypothetical protein